MYSSALDIHRRRGGCCSCCRVVDVVVKKGNADFGSVFCCGARGPSLVHQNEPPVMSVNLQRGITETVLRDVLGLLHTTTDSLLFLQRRLPTEDHRTLGR